MMSCNWQIWSHIVINFRGANYLHFYRSSVAAAAITMTTKADIAKSSAADGSYDYSMVSNGDNDLANRSPEQELSTILTKIIGRTVVKVTDLRQAVQSKSESDISDDDFVEAMQVANIVELNCKACHNMEMILVTFASIMCFVVQWMATDHQPFSSSSLCVCRQVGDNTDKASQL